MSIGDHLISISIAVLIVFLSLKLTGVVGWSWWWVTAPLWGVLALVLAVFVIAFILLVAGALLRKIGDLL